MTVAVRLALFAIPAATALAGTGQVASVSFSEGRSGQLVNAECRYGKIELSLKGAQIRSCRTAEGRELLYRPPNMDFSGTTENRGGIPVCWPWFGRNGEPGSLPHGFARYSDFSLERADTLDGGSIRLTLVLLSSEKTLALWPHEFRLEYRITLGKSLVLELESFNTGEKPMAVTKGLHPYWAVSDRRNVSLCGLDGLRYCFADETTVDDKTWKGVFVPDGHFDHVFRLSGSAGLTLCDAGNGRSLRFSGTGYSKYVIWTPAPFDDGAFENIPAKDAERFVCLEPAILFRDEPATILPGQSHIMRFEVEAM